METNTMTLPETLQEAIVYFSDADRAFEYAKHLRWPDGKVVCPRCDSDQHSFIKTRRIWYCNPCKKQFTLKIGTIFEDSPLGMDKWMTAVWMLVSCKNGISSWEIHRALGVTQKSAWFILHRIRKALQSGTFVKLAGEVEVDETFIGGKARNMHKDKRTEKIHGTGGKDKTAVMGFLQRGGEVRTTVIENRKKALLQNEVRKNVSAGAALYSDALASYDGLDGEFFHQVVDHAVEYVRGSVHTNGLENFWSLVKRALKGTYVSVEPYHLYRYLDEQAFRFNNRKGKNDAQRFELAMSKVAGRRLTYAQLTGKEDGQLHQ
jgi:transposase-like protein